MKNRKGQIGIENAPTIVMIVGLVFLTMATLAFIGEKYGSAMDTENLVGTKYNETITGLTNATGGDAFAVINLEDVICTITAVRNNTTPFTAVPATNYTSTNCRIFSTSGSGFFGQNVRVDYTYTYTQETTASNLTTDLNTELGNNSSIAGIVLTISLVGIVLSILIGVFMGISRKSSRV